MADPSPPAAGAAVVTDAPERHRFEVHVDGALAGFAEYRRKDGRYVITHTEIDDAFEGRGIGSQLARGALDAIRRHGEQVVPLCPFVRGWIDRHEAYADLVDRAALERRLRSS